MTYIQTRGHKHFHQYQVDRNTNESICLCGRVKASLNTPSGYKVPKESKYHNKTSFYKGYGYDSIKEAEYAMILDDRKKRGLILDWDRQHVIEVRVNGQPIFTMKVDFLVHMPDGSKELHEVKGVETPEFKLKKKLIDAIWLPEHPEYSYHLIK